MRDSFQQRKNSVLLKLDKSNIGEWDEKILSLCNKINKNEIYYTTSSCSGRVVLIVDSVKKGPDLFLYVCHDLISLNKFWEELKKISNKGIIKFKQEPMILHVACNSIEDAKDLLNKAHLSGFKKIGFISLGKNIVVEINGSEKLEFPIIRNRKILVDDNFLNLVIKKSNENLKSNWKKIDRLEKII